MTEELGFACPQRNKFAVPTFRSMGIRDSPEEVTYLCGNSLGLMPLQAVLNVQAEMNVWASEGVLGHHKRPDGRDPWVFNDERVAAYLADLIFGCKPSEISYTGTLTGNLNALLQAFYRPSGRRIKLMCERKAFPSDLYAFQNQVRLHGLNIEDALVLLDPEPDSDLISHERILKTIAEVGDELALVLLPGINYYSGQYFDIEAITRATHQVGAISGWDLAHASGNVPLELHDWGCDFAVFCSYKYLNSGPGNLGGLFVHENASELMQNEPRAAGWWAVDPKTRFNMEFEFKPATGARGFAQSNVCLFGPPCLLASLETYATPGGVEGLATRRQSLTGFLVTKLMTMKYYDRVFYIMTDIRRTQLQGDKPRPELRSNSTPKEGSSGMLALDRGLEHGAQISLKFISDDPEFMPEVVERLTSMGVIGDERKPNVLRWAPSPLYNTHSEIDYAVAALESVLDELVGQSQEFKHEV